MADKIQGLAAERRDGIVSVEGHGKRHRVEVRHSEDDADYLWLSDGEAADVVSQLSAVLPEARRRRAAELCRPLTGLTDEDWRVVFAFRPDLKARLHRVLAKPAGGGS